MECRIETLVEDMGSTALCDLPADEPIMCDDFLLRTEKVTESGGKTLVDGSDFVERAVFEIIEVSLFCVVSQKE